MTTCTRCHGAGCWPAVNLRGEKITQICPWCHMRGIEEATLALQEQTDRLEWDVHVASALAVVS